VRHLPASDAPSLVLISLLEALVSAD